MNSLAQYDAVCRSLQPGDVIAFWGSGLLSWAIELWDNGPSHVGIVRQGSHAGSAVTMIESTISQAGNGVQTSELRQTLAGYSGSAAALSLSFVSRRKIDWRAFYGLCGQADEHVKYDAEGVLEFLIREVPILGSRVAQDEHKDKMVCSAWVTALLSRAGLLVGINWSKVTPQDLVEMRIYNQAAPLLGKPKLRRFNTV